MRWEIDHTSRERLQDQIASCVRNGVSAGELELGEQLPPAAELGAALSVDRNTVLAAYRQLRDDGVLEFRRGRGARVVSTGPDVSIVAAGSSAADLHRSRARPRDQRSHPNHQGAVMTSPPLAGPSKHAAYTGRTTSWPMVAGTCAGALLVVLMSRTADGEWGDPMFVVPLLLVAVGALAERRDGVQRPRHRRAERLHHPLGPVRLASVQLPPRRDRQRRGDRSAVVAGLVGLLVDTEADLVHRSQRPDGAAPPVDRSHRDGDRARAGRCGDGPARSHASRAAHVTHSQPRARGSSDR